MLAIDWTGDLVSDGFWLGQPIISQFVNGPTLSRPAQGLLSCYYDTGTSGIWSRRNFTIHLTPIVYWTFNYLPLLVAVLFSRLWKVLDLTVKRNYKYAHLSAANGAAARNSLLLSYHVFWVPLSLLQGIIYRRWTIAVSSAGYVMATILIPVVQNYVFVWQLYGNGTLPEQEGTYLWMTAMVDPYWAPILMALLAATALCVLVLIVLLQRHETGLRTDLGGLIGAAEMVQDGNATNLEFAERADEVDFSELYSNIGHKRYRLEHAQPQRAGNNTTNKHQKMLRLVQSSRDNKHWLNFLRKYPPIYRCLERHITAYKESMHTTMDHARAIHKWVQNHPHFFVFNPLVFLLYLVVLLLLTTFGLYLINRMNKNSDEQYWNYVIPLPPSVYIITGVLVQSIQDVIEDAVRVLAPYDMLRRGFQPPDVLFQDYTSAGVPVYEILRAWKDGQHLLGWTILASYAVSVYTIFFGSLQQSSSSYGATSFFDDQTAAVASTILIGFVLLVNTVVGWRYCRQPWLRRPPDTLGAVLPMVLYSDKLREDIKEISQFATRKQKLERLVELDRRYAYGCFTDNNGTSRIGVERHEHSSNGVTQPIIDGVHHNNKSVSSVELRWSKQNTKVTWGIWREILYGCLKRFCGTKHE